MTENHRVLLSLFQTHNIILSKKKNTGKGSFEKSSHFAIRFILQSPAVSKHPRKQANFERNFTLIILPLTQGKRDHLRSMAIGVKLHNPWVHHPYLAWDGSQTKEIHKIRRILRSKKMSTKMKKVMDLLVYFGPQKL